MRGAFKGAVLDGSELAEPAVATASERRSRAQRNLGFIPPD